ncbi:hypothetical protein V8E36_004946 [Tilletia maclaganii]
MAASSNAVNNEAVLSLWHHVPELAHHFTLGTALINYALDRDLIEFPDASMLANVPSMLDASTMPDPWHWVLSELSHRDNIINILNADLDPIHFSYLPITIEDLHCFLRHIDAPHTIHTINVHLHQPPFNLVPAHTDAVHDTLLQHLRITDGGIVLGPVPGGASLCITTETQLIGHRIVFEWPRDCSYPRDNFSVHLIHNTLDAIDDLFVYLISPGMAVSSSSDVTRLIVNIDISVHIAQAHPRLTGARP